MYVSCLLIISLIGQSYENGYQFQQQHSFRRGRRRPPCPTRSRLLKQHSIRRSTNPKFSYSIFHKTLRLHSTVGEHHISSGNTECFTPICSRFLTCACGGCITPLPLDTSICCALASSNATAVGSSGFTSKLLGRSARRLRRRSIRSRSFSASLRGFSNLPPPPPPPVPPPPRPPPRP